MHDDLTKPSVAMRTHAMATRRGLLRFTVGAGSAALASSLPGMPWAQPVAAQDESVILVAGASEIGASPGAAFARSAAAEAAASRGAARVQAAAALAAADSDDGAITQSPVAFAAADPDEGAVAQSANAVASASSQDEDDGRANDAPLKVIAPAGRGGGGRGGGRGGGGRGRGGGRRALRAGRAGRGGGGRRDRPASLPSAGIGTPNMGPFSSLLAVASGAAGLAAIALRRRFEPVPVVPAVAIPAED